MTIAVEGTVTGSTASATSLTLTSWTPQANELVLLAVACRDESVAVSASGNGFASFVQVADVDNTQGENGVTLFRAMKATAPSTGQITVNLPSNSTPAFAVAIRLSDVDTSGSNGSGAVEASSTDVGPDPDDDDMLDSVTTLTDDAWAIAFGTHRLETFTVPGGETSISINNTAGSGGDETTLSVWYQTTPIAGSVQLGDLADLGADTDWCIIVAAVKPSGISVDVSDAVTVGESVAVDVLEAGYSIDVSDGVTAGESVAAVMPDNLAVNISDGITADESVEVFAPTIDGSFPLISVDNHGWETRLQINWSWLEPGDIHVVDSVAVGESVSVGIV